MKKIADPIKWIRTVWPDIRLYDKQVQIIESVEENEETVVPAGNGLGKDFVAGLIALSFFCRRRPCRVVTTSVKHDQLNDVLWGEIRALIERAAVKLPIQFNHLRIRQTRSDGSFVPKTELVGQVVNQGEALLGRHLPRFDGFPHTMCIFDEASGIGTAVFESSDTWAHRKLIIGNPYPCRNYFFNAVKGGDIKMPGGGPGLFRKVIRIRAEDSVNYKLAAREVELGKEPSHRILIPGLVDYQTVMKRRALWDPVRQCIGLDGKFYEGAETLLFPPDRLDLCENYAETLGDNRKPKTMGVDPAEGGDSSVWSLVDESGIIEIISQKTPDTSQIVDITASLILQHNLNPRDVYFDAGGGGKQIADQLRRKGFKVNTIAFGSTATPEKRTGRASLNQRIRETETTQVFKNKRAEMYGILSLRISDLWDGELFGIPGPDRGPGFKKLREQLSPIPRLYDGEGKMYLPSKTKKDPKSNEVTLTDLIGYSPDEADATALACYGLLHQKWRPKVG